MRVALVVALCVLVIGSVAGCRMPQGEVGVASVEVSRKGGLLWENGPDIANVAFLNIHDEANVLDGLREHATRWLEARGCTLTDNPSKAGHIVQLSIVAAGEVDPATLQWQVDAGYGSSAVFVGTGATALLADILLVQRRIPSAKRPSRARMKNISSRNAVANSQLRISLHVAGGKGNVEDYAQRFAEALSQELDNSIRAADGSTP